MTAPELDLNELERLLAAAPGQWVSNRTSLDGLPAAYKKLAVEGINALPQLIARLRAAEARVKELEAERAAVGEALSLREAEECGVGLVSLALGTVDAHRYASLRAERAEKRVKELEAACTSVAQQMPQVGGELLLCAQRGNDHPAILTVYDIVETLAEFKP